jgi:carnitine monooxygenase subunit
MSHVGRKSTTRFHSDAEKSYTLPPHYYYDRSVYEQERERIFFNSWQYVGHIGDLRNPGDYITGEILDQKVLVVRTLAWGLRAYYNLCSRRGHLLAKDKGNVGQLICPYDAWTYDLDGNLREVPNAQEVRFDLADHGLIQLPVEQFLNMVMINVNSAAKQLAGIVPGLSQEILSHVPSIAEFHYTRSDFFSLKCNWKFVFDQLECYHCPVVHPEAARAVDFRRRETAEHEWYHHAISYLDAKDRPEDLVLRAKPGDAFENNHVWYLWPNYLLVGRPGPANFSVIEALPRGPEATDLFMHYFHPTSPPLDENVRQMNQARERTWPQDIAVIESQQNGVRCRGYKGGRLMVDREHSGLSEHATHWFDKKIWEVHNTPNDQGASNPGANLTD